MSTNNNNNSSSTRIDGADLMNIMAVCSNMKTSPRKLQERLEAEMAKNGYGEDTDVGRMAAALRQVRGIVYRVNIPAAMKCLKQVT